MNILLGCAAAVVAILHFVRFHEEEPDKAGRLPLRLYKISSAIKHLALWGFVIYVLSGYKPELRQQVTELCFWGMCIVATLRERALLDLADLSLQVIKFYDPEMVKKARNGD